MIETHRELQRRFFGYFEDEGFARVEAAPIIPTADDSLLFTNATVVPLKRLIAARAVPRPGVVVAQDCLRTHNLKNAYSERVQAPFMSYFRMLGIQAAPTETRTILRRVIRYLTIVEGMPAADLLVRARSGQKFVAVGASGLPTRVDLDREAPAYYTWRYGMGDVAGDGATFAVRQPDGRFADIGNLIEMSDRGEILGYEFGFGVETFLARKHGLRGPFQASVIAQALPRCTTSVSRMERLWDALVVSAILVAEGIEPGRGRRASILRKALYALCHWFPAVDLSIEDVEEAASDLLRVEGRSPAAARRLRELAEQHLSRLMTRVQRFRDYVRRTLESAHAGRADLRRVAQRARAHGIERFQLAAELVENVLLQSDLRLEGGTQ